MRTFLRVCAAFVLAVTCVRPAVAAETFTFHLTPQDVLASVARTNAFLVSLGKDAKRLKLVPGGTTFAGQTCAGFGDVYKLAAVSVLSGPAVFPSLVTSARGKDAALLQTAFGRANATPWVPPASAAEASIPFWVGQQIPAGLRFVADGFTSGNDDGLLGPSAGGVLRFQLALSDGQTPTGPFRFLLEVIGRTSSADTPLVAFAQQRCFTFVDLEPVDAKVLKRLVQALVAAPQQPPLTGRADTIELALSRRDPVTVIDTLSLFVGHLVSRTPDLIAASASRRIAAAAFRVRHDLEFRPADADCGNGERETGESCDGADLGGFTCASVGFSGGTLGCLPICQFDTSGCVANPVCGNGVLEIGEECDAGTANSDVFPDACRTTCKRAFCGDGVIDIFEDCEGRNLDGETCASIGYDRGTLKCDPIDCFFDDEQCRDDDF